MEEREQKILEFMNDDDYVPMKAKEIAMLIRNGYATNNGRPFLSNREGTDRWNDG